MSETLEKVREKIAKNMPKDRSAALRWNKHATDKTILLSECGKYSICAVKRGAIWMYSPSRRPLTFLAYHLESLAEAKAICESHEKGNST